MANLSKKKRERMLDFLKRLKEEHKDDDSTLIAINEIENELNNKKYGLVWEEHEEAVDIKMRTHIPVFIEDKNREITKIPNGKYNFIIEGDNLHSLKLLEKTHKNKVDVIYIDPPYNSGKSDWKYNNNYIDKNDVYRHSKWLSMMSPRLEIARELLKDDGVLICAIDENELGTVIMLLDDIFGPMYSIDPITVIHNPRGIQGDNFSYVNEYAIFVYKKGYKVIENKAVEEDEIDWSPLRNWGTESERYDAANCFYPIYIKDRAIIGFGDDVTSETSFHPKQTEYDKDTDTYAVYPIDTKGVERKWRYARQTVENIAHLLRVKETKSGYDIELGKDFAPYRTVWTEKKYDANEYGSQLINSMIPENDFDFPKSVYTVYDCLRAVTLNRPNAVILDYFAGSGTTGHATLMLNKELGGNRHFILCTNNDVGEEKEKEYKRKHGDIIYESVEWQNFCNKYGIASSITYPRIKSVINGFVHNKDFKDTLFEHNITPAVIKNNKKVLDKANNIISEKADEYSNIKWVVEDNVLRILGVTKKGVDVAGIPANLKYYKTDFIEKQNEDIRESLTKHIAEMIQLEHGVKVDGNNYIMALDEDEIDKISEHWDEYNKTAKAIFKAHDVLLETEQESLFSDIPIYEIPDYYFDFELREAGEIW